MNPNARRASSSLPKWRLLLNALILAAFLLLGHSLNAAGSGARAGRVEFSDGHTLEGPISLTPGSVLKLHVGSQLRTFSLDAVTEIRMVPEKESQEQGYRFPDAGKAIKETDGQPYPVRFLRTKIVLSDGEAVEGHLYTTVLYVEAGEKAEKVLLAAKQRGKEGETLKSLVYPERVSFGEAPRAAQGATRLRLKLPALGAGAAVAALTRGSLMRLEVQPAGETGLYSLSANPAEGFFLAVQDGKRITVGWPKPADAKLLELVRKAMPNTEDFFDERKVLGAFREEDGADVYSLVLAARKGKTTLDQERSQPWRLELYRWKLDEDRRRLMLAGQDYFFRGLEAQHQALPTVVLSDPLWRVKEVDGEWVAEDVGSPTDPGQ